MFNPALIWYAEGLDRKNFKGELERFFLSLKIEKLCNQVLASKEINLWQHLRACHAVSIIPAEMKFDEANLFS